MSSPRHDADATIDALDLSCAAGIVFKRCGHAEREAERRGAVRAMLHGSRALSCALDHFTATATAHAGGVHCRADMQSEVNALRAALVDWTFAIAQAAHVDRQCAEYYAGLQAAPRASSGSVGRISTTP